MDDTGGPLTEREYWDHFWASVEVPTTVNEVGLFERAFLPILDEIVTDSAATTALEIGCAPGRWLALLHQRYGMSVTGVDSSLAGMATTRENLRLLGVPAALIETDVFSADIDGQFDLVYSLGVVEHFSSPQAIVDRHVRLAAPGGLVLIEVPVLAGVTGWLMKRLGSPLFEHHNTDVMSPSALNHLLTTAGAVPLQSGYIGGFEPSFLDGTGRSRLSRAVLAAVGRLRRKVPLTDRLGGAGLSGFCFAAARRPGPGIAS